MSRVPPGVPDIYSTAGPDSVAVDALVASVLGPAGTSDPSWRAAAYERGRLITRGTASVEAGRIGSLPDVLAELVDAVVRAPHLITDEQFAALYAAGYSPEAVHEVIVAAALGAGLERRTIGLEAIDLWVAAAGDDPGASR